MKFKTSLLVGGLFLSLLLGRQVHGQAPFYQGKTITLNMQSGEAGGTGDMRVKAVIPFLRKYVSGNPHIFGGVSARGRRTTKAGNYMFSAARPDGLIWRGGREASSPKFSHQGQGGVKSPTSTIFCSRAPRTPRATTCS